MSFAVFFSGAAVAALFIVRAAILLGAGGAIAGAVIGGCLGNAVDEERQTPFEGEDTSLCDVAAACVVGAGTASLGLRRLRMSKHNNWLSKLWTPIVTIVMLAISLVFRFDWWLTMILVAVPLLIGLIVAIVVRRPARVTGKVYDISAQGAQTTGRLQVEIPITRMVEITRQSVGALPRLRITEMTEHGGKIRGSWSIKTWGEMIELNFRAIGPTRTEVTAISSPVVSSTLTDYGQGVQDIQNLFYEIEKNELPVR